MRDAAARWQWCTVRGESEAPGICSVGTAVHGDVAGWWLLRAATAATTPPGGTAVRRRAVGRGPVSCECARRRLLTMPTRIGVAQARWNSGRRAGAAVAAS